MNRAIFYFFSILAVISMTGCFSGSVDNVTAFTPPNKANVTGEDYILQPPDDVTVIATGIPELEGAGTSSLGQTQPIRPDGVISFQRVGEIQIAGKTPRQVAEMIAQRLSSLYKITGDNPIEVRPVNKSKFYYMVGMVRDPGAKIFTGRETTLSALAKAVPNIPMAWEEKIQVIRPVADSPNKSVILELDYKKMTEQGDMTCNVLLNEGDVIYVPPTIFASIGMTFQEILGPVLQGGSVVNMVAAP